MIRTEQQRQFVEWAEAYDSILWKIARSFADGADQDDLHQELLLALWQAIPAFRGESKPSTFIYRVAMNYALAWNRRSRPDEVAIEAALDRTAPVLDDERRVEKLYEQIRRLSPFDRTLVLLYLDEFSYREMAEVLGLSESNVGVRLNRVKKQLAAGLQEVTNA